MKLVRNIMAGAAFAGLALAQPLAAQAAAPVARGSASIDQADALHGNGGAALAILAAFGALLLAGEVTGAFHLFGHDDHPPHSP